MKRSIAGVNNKSVQERQNVAERLKKGIAANEIFIQLFLPQNTAHIKFELLMPLLMAFLMSSEQLPERSEKLKRDLLMRRRKGMLLMCICI